MAAIVVNEPQFWQAIAILIKNYHAVNKKIFEVLITQVHKQQNGQLCESNEEELDQQLQEGAEMRTCNGFRVSFKLLTKKQADNIQASAVLDFDKRSYQCNFVNEAFDDFEVLLSGTRLAVTMLTERPEANQSKRWAEFVLKPKLLSWSQSEQREGANRGKSLRLVDLEKYNDLYKTLKQKHAQRLLAYWQMAKESTDPLKFIYEDLAIAAYLITLWSCTQTEPSAFADLGCGNGLLVHILNAEGHKGYGYDLRKRKLWMHYPADTQLIEQAVEPDSSNFKLPGDVDWLIGNHSDELSPWLPVLAARLSSRYFLLPCCPFELSGVKFQRRNTSISAYQDFYKYARQISEECGFETLEDRLKIPSTKRLALIGLKRRPGPDLEYFVQQELCKYKTAEQDNKMATVKLREKAETVRNCTQVAKSILDMLVLKIFNLLLAGDPTDGPKDSAWLPGRRLSMRDIAQSLTSEELRGIKSKCGGIKTLLRNNREIFEFCGNDLIGLRRPAPATALQAQKTFKKRACYFKQRHPQGCPLSDSECSFIH